MILKYLHPPIPRLASVIPLPLGRIEQYDEQDIDFLLRLNHLGDDLIRIYAISDEDVPFEVDTSPPFTNQPNERWDLISETSLKCPTKSSSN